MGPGVYLNRRMAALLLLGFGSGLPYALVGDTLKALLVDRGASLAAIGAASLVMAPYALKPLWAPFMDRFAPPLLGRRRGWLLLTQGLLLAAVAALGAAGRAGSLGAISALALLVSFLSASQDIAADAYRADVLPPRERGPGAAVFVNGYRAAQLAGAAGALLLVGGLGLSWTAAYTLLSACLLLAVGGTLLAPEPRTAVAPPRTVRDAYLGPLRQLRARPDVVALVAFIALFKLPDALGNAMAVPFLLELGFDLGEIGTLRQGLGLGITVAGTFAGGWLTARIGLRRALWVFGGLQAVSNLGFAGLALLGPHRGALAAAVAVENFSAGMVAAGFVAFLMSRCDARHSAVQYALFSSLMMLVGLGLSPLAGLAAAELPWPAFFLATAVAGLPGLALIPFLGGPPSVPDTSALQAA